MRLIFSGALVTVLLALFSCNNEGVGTDEISFCDCANSETEYIVGADTFFLANIFSPNGDGVYDTWSSQLFNDNVTFSIVIEDMDGQEVLNTSEPDDVNSFVGTGDMSSDNSDNKYHYYLTINGQTFEGYVCSYGGCKHPHSYYECILDTDPGEGSDPVLDPAWDMTGCD